MSNYHTIAVDQASPLGELVTSVMLLNEANPTPPSIRDISYDLGWSNNKTRKKVRKAIDQGLLVNRKLNERGASARIVVADGVELI